MDDHALFAEMLEVGLRCEGFDAVRVARDLSPTGLIAEALAFHPDVVLIDLDLGADGSALPAIQALVGQGAWVVLVTAARNRLALAEALEAGAIGVVPKTASIHGLSRLIRDIAAGLSVFAPSDREELLGALAGERAAKQARREPFEHLTPRERDVLSLLMDGKSADEIAADRVVSVTTVRTQIQTIFRKLGVNSQLAAVVLAREAGWA